MQVEVQIFQAPTSNGLQTIISSELGAIVPKAVLFGFVGAEPLLQNDLHAKIGGGATDGTRSWAVTGRSQDNVSPSNCARITSQTACLAIMDDSADVLLGFANFDAFVAGGVRVNWADAPNEAYFGFAMFFAGADVSARADTVTLLQEDIELDINNVAFKPKCIIGWSALHDGVSLAHFRQSFGFAALNGTGTAYAQKALCYSREDAEAVETSSVLKVSTNRIGCRTAPGGTGDYSLEAANPDASGFSIFARDNPSGGDLWSYLALTMDEECEVFDYDPPTATGNDSFSGLGITPQAVLLGSTSANDRDTRFENAQGGVAGYHAFTDSDEMSLSHADQDAQATSDTNCFATGEGFRSHSEETSGSNYAGTLVSMDVNGFTANYTIVQEDARRWIGLAFEFLSAVNVSGQISHAFLDVPDVKSVGNVQVSWAELKTPNPPGGGLQPFDFIAQKEFNEPRFREELAVFGLDPDSIEWIGFVQQDETVDVDHLTPLCYHPFGLFAPDGNRGEFRMFYSFGLTGGQIGLIQLVVDAHFCDIESIGQSNARQRGLDIAVLFDSYNSFSTLTDEEKDECLRLIKRILLQNEGFGVSANPLDVDARVEISKMELEVPDP